MVDKIYKILKPFIATKKSKLQLANVIDEIKTNTLTLYLYKDYYEASGYYTKIYTEDKKLLYSDSDNKGIFFENSDKLVEYLNKFDKIIIKEYSYYYEVGYYLHVIKALYKASYIPVTENVPNRKHSYISFTSTNIDLNDNAIYDYIIISYNYNTQKYVLRTQFFDLSV